MIGRDVRTPRTVIPGHGRTVTVHVQCACGARFEQEQRAVVDAGGYGLVAFELPCPSCERRCAGTLPLQEPPPGPNGWSMSVGVGGDGVIATVGLNGHELARAAADQGYAGCLRPGVG